MIYYLPEPGCLFRIEPTRDTALYGSLGPECILTVG